MRTTSWPIAALLLLGCSPSPETRPARPIGPPVAAEARALGIDDLVAASGPGVVLFDARDGEPLALPWGSVRNLTLGEGFGAGEADVLELEVVDLPRPGAIEVRWRSSEGEDAGLAVLSATGRDAMDGGRLRYALGRSPAWRGRPGEVRLSYSGPRDATPRLLSARLIVLEVDPAKVSELAGEAWRVEIDHELRTASLTTRGVPVRAELPVSGAARLTIEAGVVAGPAAALAVEVAFLGGSGEVLDRVRKTGDPLSAEAGWQRLGFDLAPPARTRGVRLAIEPAPGTVAAPTAIAVSDVTWRPDGPGDAPPRGHRNVVLISIDTLRADRLSSSSGRPERTPALEAWRRRRAVQFDVAWSAAPSTLPSHASMFTGVGPLRHGAYLETPLAPAAATMAERLSERGYRTAAFTGGGYLHPAYGLDQGFARFRYWPRPPGGRTRDLPASVSAALDFLAEPDDRPFLVFLHTYDVHGPYRRLSPAGDERLRVEPRSRGPVAELGYFDADRWPVVIEGGRRRDLRRAEAPEVAAIYDEGVRRMDEQIGRLLAGLERLGLADSTLVVFTSDHGESLGEEGYWGHGYLWSSNLAVPLLISAPGLGRPGAHVAEPAGLCDLLPTILEWTGAASPGADLPGRSLLPLLADAAEPPGAGGGRGFWAYAPETNHGLTAIDGDAKLVVADSPFRGVEAIEGWRTLDDAPLPDASRRAVREAELRRAAAKRIAEARSGTFLRFENRGSSATKVGVLAAELGSNAIKKVGPLALQADFVEGGGFAIELPAGADWTLRVQALPSGSRLELAVTEPEAARGALVLEADRLCVAPIVADWEAGRSVPLVVSAFRRDDCRESTLPAASAELEEQLRALGYLN